MIVVKEENRISWEELFELVIGKEEMERDELAMKEKQKKKAEAAYKAGLASNHEYLITRQTLDLRRQEAEEGNGIIGSESDENIYQNVDLMMEKYYYKNEQTLKAKEARNQLENEIQKAKFFDRVRKKANCKCS